MKKMYFPLLLGAVLVLLSACKDEELRPIATFDSAEKGAYVRLITQSNDQVNLDDLTNSKMEYSIEFVDLEKGNLVSEYRLSLMYDDNNPDNGDNSVGPVAFRSWTSSEFSTNKSGFKGIENIVITATEVINTAGVNIEEVKSGDAFQLIGSVTTTSGQTFTRTNSSAAVNGASFRGFFNFAMNAFCPSNLEGTYRYQTPGASITCFKGGTVEEDLSGEVTIVALGNGQYNFSDWSFGAYNACGGSVKAADSGSLTFTETCRAVDFSGKVDKFDEKWAFSSTVEGNTWKINWENTAEEKGETVLIKEDGWNFVIEE